MNICVGNLSDEVTVGNLRDLFEPFGCVEKADVVGRGGGDESRQLGFIDMPVRSEGVCAVLGVHGRSLSGRTITATEVRPSEPLSEACHVRCGCH